VFLRLSFGLPIGSSVPAANPSVKPTLVMILPVVVRCIVGIIPHTMKKELWRTLDAALQELHQSSRRMGFSFIGATPTAKTESLFTIIRP
jgi:hypothetical protein